MSTSQNENIKYALCYIPLVAFVILFIENDKDTELKKHIRYGIILFFIYFILTSLIGLIFFGLAFMLNGLITLFYLVFSGVLGYRAYVGDKTEVNILNDIENKVKDTFK